MSNETKSTDELKALSERMATEELSTEELLQIQGNSPQGGGAPTEEVEKLIVNLEEGDEPSTPEDNPPVVAPTVSPKEGEDNPPAPQPQPTQLPDITDEQYSAIIAEHPELAKFTKEEFVKKLADSYVNLEKKYSSKPPEPSPASDDPAYRAKINSEILETVNARIQNDPQILDNLIIRDENNEVVEVVPLPQTKEEWTAFKRKHPAEFIDIRERARTIADEVNGQVGEREKIKAEAPAHNSQAVEHFADRVVAYVKKVNPNVEQKDRENIAKKILDYAQKAHNTDTFKNGKGLINENALYGQFIAENEDMFSALRNVTANNNRETKARETIHKLTKGKTMKTLGSESVTSKGTKREINVLNPIERDKLPTEVLRAISEELVK